MGREDERGFYGLMSVWHWLKVQEAEYYERSLGFHERWELVLDQVVKDPERALTLLYLLLPHSLQFTSHYTPPAYPKPLWWYAIHIFPLSTFPNGRFLLSLSQLMLSQCPVNINMRNICIRRSVINTVLIC